MSHTVWARRGHNTRKEVRGATLGYHREGKSALLVACKMGDASRGGCMELSASVGIASGLTSFERSTAVALACYILRSSRAPGHG